MKKRERLTTDKTKIFARENPTLMSMNKDELRKHYNEIFDRLQEYEVAMETGDIIALPCKIGDYVYYISTENPFVAFEKELKPRKVCAPINGILITKDDIYISTENIDEVIDLCDKVNEDYAYLSEADAEAAISKMQQGG